MRKGREGERGGQRGKEERVGEVRNGGGRKVEGRAGRKDGERRRSE